MTKAEKNQQIDALAEMLAQNSNFYIADTSALSSDVTSKLRRECFNKKISLHVVKNTLLKKAMERSSSKFEEMYDSLAGPTAIMFCEAISEPAKVIKEFRKTNPKPLLKAAYIQESVYVGDNQLEALASIKSKDELIADIIALLQSPAKNVVSALQSGGGKLAGIVETLSKK